MADNDLKTLTSSDDSATDQNYTSVTGTDVTVSGTPKRALDTKVTNQSGADAVPIQDGGNSITVDATDLDIRDLSHTQDSVRLGDGTELVNVNASNELQTRDDDANTSLTSIDGKLVDGNDIGDVTVNNASGANAVNVQDGGNSITTDTTNATSSVAIGDASSIIDVQTLDSAFDDTGNGIIITGVRQDADGSPVSADGDAHPLIFTSTGLLKVDSSINPVPSQNTIEQIEFLLNSGNKNMNVDGSSTPVVFDFSPGAGEVFQIGSICFYMGQAGGLASDKFENISALTTGMLVEIQADGILRTFSNLQSNADLGVIFFGGSSTGSKSSWEGAATFGATTRIDGDQSDFIRATIRDDLTGVILIQMAVTAAELL